MGKTFGPIDCIIILKSSLAIHHFGKLSYFTIDESFEYKNK
jgi:hypothetical protein